MQDVLIAGDTLDFDTAVPDYPATDGWTLSHVLIPRFRTPTQAPVTLTATTYEVSNYRTQAGPTETAEWTPGVYAWLSYVTKTGARQTVAEGVVEVKPDPVASVQGYDSRSQAEIALDDARTALANFQQSGGRVKRYQIAGREMEFDAAGDILKLVSYWQNEVTRERAANAQRDGLPDPRRIYLRIGRA